MRQRRIAAPSHATAKAASVASRPTVLMRVAVISDIHGNWHALEAVLRAIDGESPDAIWCLGDVVGYGPRPNRCCARVEEVAGVTLVGNHDLGVLGTISIDEFSGDAAAAARWTAEVLEDGPRAFLAGLAPQAELPGAELYHGSPRDPVWDYVLTEEIAGASLELTSAPVVLVGHSHLPLALGLVDGEIMGGIAPGGTELELEDARFLLNPGSVGQPRDGDSRAAWLLLDQARGLASFRRTDYAIEQTQAEIRERGLPPVLAERLALGA